MDTTPKFSFSEVKADKEHSYLLYELTNHVNENSDQEILQLKRVLQNKQEFRLMTEREQSIYLDRSISFDKLKLNISKFISDQYKLIDYKANKCQYNRCYKDIGVSADLIRKCSNICLRDKAKFIHKVENSMSKLLRLFECI